MPQQDCQVKHVLTDQQELFTKHVVITKEIFTNCVSSARTRTLDDKLLFSKDNGPGSLFLYAQKS